MAMARAPSEFEREFPVLVVPGTDRLKTQPWSLMAKGAAIGVGITDNILTLLTQTVGLPL